MLAAWAVGLVALAVLGGLNALYFVLVDAGRIRPDARFVPPVCRMDDATCRRVLDTRYARLFGVSNATLGLVWYALAAGAAVFALAADAFPLCGSMIVAGVATVLVSVYLAWALLVRLRTPCVLCFAGHTVNALILAALIGACVSA